MTKYPDIMYNNLYIVFKRKPSRCPQRDRIKFSSFYRFIYELYQQQPTRQIFFWLLYLSPFLSLGKFFFR